MGPGRRTRTDTAIDRELRYWVFKNVQRISSSMVVVGRRQMTGNLTDEDLIRMATTQRAQNRRRKHVCFCVFWGEQITCKPPCGSVKADFFQKGRQIQLVAGIDASPLVKRETQHKTHTLHPSRKSQRRRSIYGPASRSYVKSEERFLFSQTHICNELAWDGLWEPVKRGRSVFCTGNLFLQTGTRASQRQKTGKNRRAFDDGSGPAAPRTLTPRTCMRPCRWTTTTGTRRSWWWKRAAREGPIGSSVEISCAS